MKAPMTTILCLCILLTGIANAQDSQATRQQTEITSATVTLNVEKQEISSVLKMISLSTNINIVSSPEVTGEVSINLYKVPIEEALDVVLGMAGFTYYRRGNIIVVTSESERGELPLSVKDLKTRSFRINHGDAEEINKVISEMVSEAGKSVVVPRNKSIVVIDTEEYLKLIEQVIKAQDTPPLQVMISVHVLRLDRSDNTSLGVELKAQSQSTLGDLWTLSTGEGGLAWSKVMHDKSIDINAKQVRDNIDTLARPEVMVIDGKTATILIGDRLGYKTTARADDGTTFENINFLETGTELLVTPDIGTDGNIRMNIYPKVSNGEINSEGLPEENTTEMETTLQVKDGDTIILGGLITRHKQRTRNQVPILGNIPYLGLLFGRNVWDEREVEIVVFLTPHIVPSHNTEFVTETIDRYTSQSQVIKDPIAKPIEGAPDLGAREPEWTVPGGYLNPKMNDR